MTIVTKNSLTVSNVNDGTITHYAYANSADGKDGFYVGGGTNLLINSNFSSGLANWHTNLGNNKDCKAVVTTDSDGDTCIHITGTGSSCGIYSSPSPFNQNQITTGSVLAKGTGIIQVVGLEGRLTSNFGTVSTESYSKVGSTTQASSNTNAFVVYFSPVNNIVDVYIKFVKLEQGDKATPWSPAPSEAHPSYIGQYTDFNTTASTDPTKYRWSLIKGSDSYTHTAYSWSADGKDGFTTVYPNLNLLDGTKDFSGNWLRTGNWTNDGTYKGLTVKKKTSQWDGINKIFTASKDGVYTFSAYVKSSGNTANIFRYCGINSTSANAVQRQMGNNFDWIRDSVTLNLKANDTVWVRYEISGSGTDSILWNAGHKWEQGSTATPYMPSESEVKTSDYPSYIGTYSDSNVEASLDYSKYQWAIFKGQNSNAYVAYSWSSDGADRFSTVYPNFNLLEGSKKYTKTNPKIVSSSASDGVFFLNDVFVKNLKAGTYTMSGKSDAPWTVHAISAANRQDKVGLWLVSTTPGLNVNISLGDTVPKTINVPQDGDYCVRVNTYSNNNDMVTHSFWDFKLEPGSTATPYMPSESEAQDQWQDAIPMYIGVGEKDSQNPSDYRWQLNSKYVQASSDSGLSNKAGVDDLASVADTANDALVQAQNAVSNEDYTSWLEHDYQSTIDDLQDVSIQNQEDIRNVDDRTTAVEGFYDEMKIKWNFIDESFTFSEEGMFISNSQSKMAIQVTSDKIVFWDNDVDVAFITGEVLNIQKGVFLESATIGNHLITKFSDDSPVTIITYVGGIN